MIEHWICLRLIKHLFNTNSNETKFYYIDNIEKSSISISTLWSVRSLKWNNTLLDVELKSLEIMYYLNVRNNDSYKERVKRYCTVKDF